MRRLLIVSAVTASAALALTAYQLAPPSSPFVIPSENRVFADRTPNSAEELIEEATLFRTTYEFKRKIEATLSGKTLTNVSYEGTLFVDWKATSDLGKSAVLSFQLKQVPDQKAKMKIRLDRDHRLVSVKIPEGLSQADLDAISILKDLVSILAYRHGEDSTGKYRFTEKETQDVSSKETVWTKQKIAYESKALSMIRFLKSHHETRTSFGTQTPVYFRGREETQLGATKDSLFTVSEYTLRKKGHEETALDHAQDSTIWKESKLELDSSENIFARVDWKEIETALPLTGTLRGPERLQFFRKTVKALKTDPSKTKALRDWISRHRGNAKMASFGIGALATHGTPEAQKELLDLFSEFGKTRQTKSLQHTILGSFTTTEAKLIPETRTFLSELAGQKETDLDLAMNATLAMGSAMKKEPTAADEQRLGELAATAQDREEKLAYLDAIGNSGSANLISVVEDHLRSPDATIREKATFALRWMESEQATGLIVRSFEDPDVRVKSAAVKAVSYQKDFSAYQSMLATCVQKPASEKIGDLCKSVAQAQHEAE